MNWTKHHSYIDNSNINKSDDIDGMVYHLSFPPILSGYLMKCYDIHAHAVFISDAYSYVRATKELEELYPLILQNGFIVGYDFINEDYPDYREITNQSIIDFTAKSNLTFEQRKQELGIRYILQKTN
uniref:Uncharacterized protein n=1 Tax=Acrobeloides nanus TaxID=290746 RepID=A0A914C6S1_9BILA